VRLGRLQEAVKPLLIPLVNGEWRLLAPWERKTLALWMSLLAMVWEFADVTSQTTTQAEREEFCSTLEPPKGWWFLVGRMAPGDLWDAAIDQVNAAAYDLDANQVCGIVSRTAAVANCLYFCVMRSTVPNDDDDIQALANEKGVSVLWPPLQNPMPIPQNEMLALEAAQIHRIPGVPHQFRWPWECDDTAPLDRDGARGAIVTFWKA
jgi:hypothetical protein